MLLNTDLNTPSKEIPKPSYALLDPVRALGRRIGTCLSSIIEFLKRLFGASVGSTTTERKPLIANRLEGSLQSPGRHPLMDFYNGIGTNGKGGASLEFLSIEADDQYLEERHDWVQWAFPLETRSNFNLSAPLLTSEIIQQFHNSPQLQEKLLSIFKRTLSFYGLHLDEINGRVVDGVNFAERSKATWAQKNDHNHLRITRILQSLQLLQAPDQKFSWSKAFFSYLEEYQKQHPDTVSSRNFSFWGRTQQR